LAVFGSDNQDEEERSDDGTGLFDKVSGKAGEAVETLDVENPVTIHFRDDTPPVDCLVVWTISRGRLVKAEFAGTDDDHARDERRVYPMDRIEYIEGHERGVMPNETREVDYDSELMEAVAEATR
jgi:hypothetical protein